jgi:ribosomal protein S2
VDIPIPANDDSIRAIHLITKTLADTIMEAKRGSKKQQKDAPAEKAEKVVEEKKEEK